jgi:hypothetical protein
MNSTGIEILTPEIEGKLTKKQEQSVKLMEAIITSFYDEQYRKKPRTWSELKNLSKLSSAALSKYLGMLTQQGVVKREVIINSQNRERRAYVHDSKKPIVMKGKAYTAIDVCSFYFPKGRANPLTVFQYGSFQRGKRKYPYGIERFVVKNTKGEYSQRFVASPEAFEILPTNLDDLRLKGRLSLMGPGRSNLIILRRPKKRVFSA